MIFPKTYCKFIQAQFKEKLACPWPLQMALHNGIDGAVRMFTVVERINRQLVLLDRVSMLLLEVRRQRHLFVFDKLLQARDITQCTNTDLPRNLMPVT